MSCGWGTIAIQEIRDLKEANGDSQDVEKVIGLSSRVKTIYGIKEG